MHTSARSAFLHCSRTTSLTSRTAVYGPVRTVVWQGSAGDCRPYADQVGQCLGIRNSERASMQGYRDPERFSVFILEEGGRLGLKLFPLELFPDRRPYGPNQPNALFYCATIGAWCRISQCEKGTYESSRW